jgi:uncharacterized protein (DUF849 family)
VAGLEPLAATHAGLARADERPAELSVWPGRFTTMLKAALNGDRPPGSHPRLPLTAAALAADAASCAGAGASAVHIHPRDGDGRESLAAEVIDETVRAVRSAAGVAVGVSTGAWIEPDPGRRAEAVAAWREPDMASVNLSEAGAADVMAALWEAGIGIEAGIWSLDDVERLADSGFATRLVRVLVEIRHPSPDPAANALAIDQALDRLRADVPRLHHGEEEATWPVLRQAVSLGHDIRIGLEDTLLLPDGSRARSNADLVTAAARLAGLR